jgi:HSP20 family protein
MMNSMMRWNPFREMAEMQRAMDRLFDEVSAPNWSRTGAWSGLGDFSSLSMDIHETDSGYTVKVPLPGVNPAEINIRMQNGVLTISGELPQPTMEANTKVVMQERVYGKFSRSVSLPQSVNEDQVEASYENGILSLTLPKLPEAQPKQIPVKTANLLQSKN